MLDAEEHNEIDGAVKPEILIAMPSNFYDINGYAKAYDETSPGRAKLEAVVEKVKTDPSIEIPFEMRAGTSETNRKFSEMKDSFAAWAQELAKVARQRGYNLEVALDLNRIRSVYDDEGRVFNHDGAGHQDESLPTKYLFCTELGGDDGIYAGSALVGYKMVARLVDEFPTPAKR
jgi:hypothetical protein